MSDPVVTPATGEVVEVTGGAGSGGAAQAVAVTATHIETELDRYERLANASVALAQRQADEAAQRSVQATLECRRLRRYCVASMAAAGCVCLLAVSAVVVFAFTASSAVAEANAQKALAIKTQEDALRVADELRVLEREHAVLIAKVKEADDRVAAAHELVEAKTAEVARIQTQKTQVETALQAALVSLYSSSAKKPNDTVTASVETPLQ